jgi:Glycosyltransferase family 10 (fucosyltransferase) C-term
MPRTLGVFHEHHRSADFLWNQCEAGHGESGEWTVRSGDRAADHVLVINWVVGPEGLVRSRGWRRPLYKLLRRPTTPLRVCPGYEWLDRPPARTWALAYEPPPYPSDWYYQYTRSRCERVYGPDPRATHPRVLPSMWTLEADLATLRGLPPPPKTWPLATVTSGRQLLAGHASRMDFLRRIRAEGMPLRLFGRGLPQDLGGMGEVASKASALLPARFALVIENYAEGDQYVTEKLWDALLCWCLPVYLGSRAADAMIPPEAIVRLPDLGEGGLETLQRTLATPRLWEERLPAIAEARRRALGDLRLVEWIKRELAAAGR